MASAKCLVILDKLLRSEDFNVRVTVVKAQTSSEFKESIRDSLGGEIIHSEESFSVEAETVSSIGTAEELKVFKSIMGSTIKGGKIADYLLNNYCTTIGVRITIDKRTWIVVQS